MKKNKKHTFDKVLGKCNVSKVLKQKTKAIKDEYEFFKKMHTNNGTNNKCTSKL